MGLPRRYFLTQEKPAWAVASTCPKCKQDYVADFYKSVTLDGQPCWRPYSRCKPCRRWASTKWYRANPERAKALAKEWKKSHPERLQGKWYGNKAAFNYYAKLRLAGVSKDEARSAAVKFWRENEAKDKKASG